VYQAAAEQRDGMWAFFWKINAQEHMWSRLVLDAAVAREAGVDVEDLEQRLWDRMGEDDEFWSELLDAEPSNVVSIREAA
jgi:hypothetical protein